MKFISPKVHGALDYAVASVLVVAPLILRFADVSVAAAAIAVAAGVGLFVYSLLNLGIGVFAERSMPINWPFLAAITYTAIFALGLCYTLQIWAQRHTPPADAALILSLESVFSVLSGWLILHEKLAVVQILGCTLIFSAVLLSQFKEWNLRGTIERDHLIEGR